MRAEIAIFVLTVNIFGVCQVGGENSFLKMGSAFLGEYSNVELFISM